MSILDRYLAYADAFELKLALRVLDVQREAGDVAHRVGIGYLL